MFSRTRVRIALLLLTISGWWWLTLMTHSSSSQSKEGIPQEKISLELSRNELKAALAGNVELIAEFLEKWEREALLVGSPHLSHEESERARKLAYQLLHYSEEQLTLLREAHRTKEIINGCS